MNIGKVSVNLRWRLPKINDCSGIQTTKGESLIVNSHNPTQFIKSDSCYVLIRFFQDTFEPYNYHILNASRTLSGTVLFIVIGSVTLL